MKWINCGKRFPEDWQYVIIRHKPTKTIITEQNVSEAQSDYFEMENGVDYNYVDCEWLDETDESPSSDPAEVLVKALEEIAGYVAHNGDDWAKRTAETALLKHKNQANEVNNDTKNEG